MSTLFAAQFELQSRGKILCSFPASATYSVETVVGGTAKLPCNITPELSGDKTGIVIWFKDGEDSKVPMYTLVIYNFAEDAKSVRSF